MDVENPHNCPVPGPDVSPEPAASDAAAPGSSGDPAPANDVAVIRGSAPTAAGADDAEPSAGLARVIAFARRDGTDRPAVGERAAADPPSAGPPAENGDDRPQAPTSPRRRSRVAEEPVDWAWVEEWRRGREPVPWGPGLTVAAFSAALVGVAIWVLSAGLQGRPVLAVVVNLLVAGGLVPAMWLSRGLPVLRWIALGCGVGVAVGWIAALIMLPTA